VGRDGYVWSTRAFLATLGAIHFVAFLSIAAQIVPLIGESGILSAAHYLDRVRAALPDAWFRRAPTIFWIDASDSTLFAVAILGAAIALLAVFPIRGRRWLFLLLWALYLSICTVGRSFLAFQWDILLLEISWLGFFLASPRGPRPIALFIARLVLWKLMFMSGYAKWTSGDEAWRDLSALLYHYETQPLPTVLGWWAHQLPGAIQSASVASMFVIQLLVPFLVFVPNARRWAFFPLVGLQVLIALTGNYGFFNLLAIALCFLLLDDALFARVLPRSLRALWREPITERMPASIADVPAGVFLALQVVLLFGRFFGAEAVDVVLDPLQPFRSINGYGLFAVMTTERKEIILEGSADGKTWRPYVLPDQPGPLDRAPPSIAPHMPRLDWQMWFAALGEPRQSPWLYALTDRLLEGAPEPKRLLAVDPFPDDPPEQIRATLWRYRFTTIEERRATGAYWKREPLGEYFPARSLSGNL
jgi:lipase maturation factor 1